MNHTFVCRIFADHVAILKGVFEVIQAATIKMDTHKTWLFGCSDPNLLSKRPTVRQMSVVSERFGHKMQMVTQ